MNFRHLKLQIFCASFFMLALAAVSWAQAPDKIVKQAAKALGGERNLRRITSWQVSGAIVRQSDSAQGSYRMMLSKPDSYALAIEIGGFEASEGFNGKSGWRRDSRIGLRTVTGLAANQFRAEAAYRNNLWLNYQKDKAKLAYAGQEPVNGKPAHVVVLTNPRNVKIKMWFDASSSLPVKEEIPAGEGVKTLEYSDHRPVNGVMEPHSIRLTGDGETFVITLDRITHNPPADRAAFDFPKLSGEPLPEIDALLKQVVDNQNTLEQLLENYTYTMDFTAREFDKNGALKVKETETRDISYYKGRGISRLVAKTGKPLTPDEQAKEDKDIEKQIRDIEKRAANQQKKPHRERKRAKTTAASPSPSCCAHRNSLTPAANASANAKSSSSISSRIPATNCRRILKSSCINSAARSGWMPATGRWRGWKRN